MKRVLILIPLLLVMACWSPPPREGPSPESISVTLSPDIIDYTVSFDQIDLTAEVVSYQIFDNSDESLFFQRSYQSVGVPGKGFAIQIDYPPAEVVLITSIAQDNILTTRAQRQNLGHSGNITSGTRVAFV